MQPACVEGSIARRDGAGVGLTTRKGGCAADGAGVRVVHGEGANGGVGGVDDRDAGGEAMGLGSDEGDVGAESGRGSGERG